MPDEILLRGGRVVDGTGAPMRRMDVLLRGDRIREVARKIPADASRVRIIDLEERVVAPGFIDAHSHSDITLLHLPGCHSKILQGVTTEIIGNCGFSAAPLQGEGLERVRETWKRFDVEIDWTDFEGYRRRLEAAPPAVNVAALVGHNNLRAGIIGYADRPAAAEEIAGMAELARRAMQQGALGLSTGLAYSPGLFADTAELVELAAAVGEFGGLYASHMRSEGDRLLESIDETLEIGRKARVPVQISHLKASGRSNWDKLDAAFDRIAAAAADGLPVYCDRYPYTASWTDLDTILPSWAFDGGTDRLLERLADPGHRERLVRELESSRHAGAWDRIRIAGTEKESLRSLEGRSILELARERGVPPPIFVLDLLREDRCRTGAFFFTMAEENMRRVLRHPRCVIGSDASARPFPLPPDASKPHPRAFGTFPRAVGDLVREGLFSLEEAVFRSTGLTARIFGLKDRGTIRKGAAADLVVFDPESLSDRTSWADPARPPSGIEQVWVNGRLAVDRGVPTGVAAGRFLPGPAAR